jgi:succinate dehydrogenase / fumarate reductase membrane anchor subunit
MSAPINDLRHPIARARGLGSAKDGAHHFIVQRITAVALVPLSLWFLFCVLPLTGAPYADARVYFAQPLHASLMAFFVMTLFYHAALGIQVVVEDYIHVRWLEYTLLLATKFACLLAVIASLFALVRIAIGA